MELPRFVVLKSNYNDKYLRYIKEDVQELHGFLKFSGEEVVSPYAKYRVEKAKSGNGLVHIRCCYNNKYWVRSPNTEDNLWIVAVADEPEEDQTQNSCTLFEPVYVDGDGDGDGDATLRVRFRHVHLGLYACLRRMTGQVYDSGLFLELELESPNTEDCDVCTIIDWESLLILPKHVAFKGDNGKYLAACGQYLGFSSSDIGDPMVGNEVFTTSNGSVRIKSDASSKFWGLQGQLIMIMADSNDHNNLDTLFWPIKVDNNVVALRNLGNNHFCIRFSANSYLSATVSTISKEARVEVEELVLSRKIYNVNYRLMDARIYSQSVLTMANANAVNRTKEPSTIELKLSHTDTKSYTWNSSVSLNLGVTTTIETGIPFIEKGKIQISAEFTGEYKWGSTQESTTHGVETMYKVTVPPMTMVKVSLLATKGSCDVPFSYSQRDTLTNGKQITSTTDDGVYTSSNYYNFQFETKEEKL